MTTVSAGEGPLGRLVSFIRSDHRYVLLGTSAIAAAGMALSASPRPSLSFMTHAYALEVAVYYLLAAWLVIAAIALVFKLTRWKAYANASPFTRPGVVRALRYGSYAVTAMTAVLAIDRVGCGLASAWAVATTATTRPSRHAREHALHALQRSRHLCRGLKTTVALAVFGTVIAFFLALLLVFLRIQVIDRRTTTSCAFGRSWAADSPARTAPWCAARP